MTRPA
ncbi:unnamed protein product, partial [Didymodactylos carnosus]|jgi:hypothetical protein